MSRPWLSLSTFTSLIPSLASPFLLILIPPPASIYHSVFFFTNQLIPSALTSPPPVSTCVSSLSLFDPHFTSSLDLTCLLHLHHPSFLPPIASPIPASRLLLLYSCFSFLHRFTPQPLPTHFSPLTLSGAPVNSQKCKGCQCSGDSVIDPSHSPVPGHSS